MMEMILKYFCTMAAQLLNFTDNDLDDIALTTILSGSNVVWSGNDGNDFEVFLYNGSETTQLTDNDIDDRFVKISDDNNIVWQQQNISESGEGPRSIFLATLWQRRSYYRSQYSI